MTADADLSAELAEARRRLAELEASEAERRQGEQWSSVCMYISKMSVAKRLFEHDPVVSEQAPPRAE